MEKKKPNCITFIESPQVRMRREKNNSISTYLEKNAPWLEKRESSREAEYAATRQFIAQMVIKADATQSSKDQSVIRIFAEQFLQNEDHVLKMNYDPQKDMPEIAEICGDYISAIEEPEIPVSGLYEDENGKPISIKPRNFVAQFSFRSFCISMGQIIALRVAMGRYDGSEESILELIVIIAQTLASLASQAKIKFSDDEELMLKTIISETGAGRCSVEESQIIKQFTKKYTGNKTKIEISKIIDKFDDLQIISIENGFISLSEKLYF